MGRRRAGSQPEELQLAAVNMSDAAGLPPTSLIYLCLGRRQRHVPVAYQSVAGDLRRRRRSLLDGRTPTDRVQLPWDDASPRAGGRPDRASSYRRVRQTGRTANLSLSLISVLRPSQRAFRIPYKAKFNAEMTRAAIGNCRLDCRL